MRAAARDIDGPGALVIARDHKPALPSNSPKRDTCDASAITAHRVRKLRMLVAFQRGRRDVGRVYCRQRVWQRIAITVAQLALFELASIRQNVVRILIFSKPECNTRLILLPIELIPTPQTS
jgi:hypothetical protein